jgi:hypothetical protein
LALIFGSVFGAGSVAACDGGYEERVGVGVGLGFEDVANTKVDEGGGERLLYWCTGFMLA